MSRNSRRLPAQPLRRLLAALDARERELRALVAERREALEDADTAGDPAGDEADRAFGRVRGTVESDLLELHLRELARIEAARERAAQGRYGLCADCGEPIPRARLDANPTALRCAECQGRRERLFPAAP